MSSPNVRTHADDTRALFVRTLLMLLGNKPRAQSQALKARATIPPAKTKKKRAYERMSARHVAAYLPRWRRKRVDANLHAARGVRGRVMRQISVGENHAQ